MFFGLVRNNFQVFLSVTEIHVNISTYIPEQSQNIGPFQLSAILKQGTPPEVMDTRPLNPLTNDTFHRCIFKKLHSTVQELLKLESESLELEVGATLPNK